MAEAAGGSAKVILFGSHARGDAVPDSDVDFLVIEPEVEDRHREWNRLRQALGDIQIPVDIIVLDEAVAGRRAKVPGTMVYHAVRDGRVITQPEGLEVTELLARRAAVDLKVAQKLSHPIQRSRKARSGSTPSKRSRRR